MPGRTLAKADLSTGMVGEFPELQGIMGRYYALHDGEDKMSPTRSPSIIAARPNDACPTAPVSVVVALADKIDTLVGFFAIDEKPTGSRDPLRCAARHWADPAHSRKQSAPAARRKHIYSAPEPDRAVPPAGESSEIPGGCVAELFAFVADRLRCTCATRACGTI